MEKYVINLRYLYIYKYFLTPSILYKILYCSHVTEASEVTLKQFLRGHGGRVVTFLPPTSETGVRFPARPQMGKLVVACHWSAVYSTGP